MTQIRSTELEAALVKYGEHLQKCYKRLTVGAFCDCGLEEALKNKAESHTPECWTKNWERLWELADGDKCEGNCDLEPPHKQCPECLATGVINECGELLDGVLDAMQEAEKSK